MSVMPVQKPGRSKQDYSTPDEFIEAVKGLLGISYFDLDLAADESNSKGYRYINEEMDSLSVEWPRLDGWCWLNPPFANIEPWAKKCWTSGIRAAFLVPASVGANWFRDWVDGKAYVFFLSPRLSFDGKDPYPKDCILALYGTGMTGYKCWDWRKSVRR
jgi:phage N-6-adenine-methyltransferase